MAGLRHRSQPPVPLPADFTLDGHRLTLPALPTRQWLRALACEPPGCWFQLIPLGMRAQDREHLVRRLTDVDDPWDLDDAEELAQDVLSPVLGMDLWAAHRLARMAYSNWLAFDSWCVRHGLDPMRITPGRLVSAVYAWRLAACEKQSDVTKLDADVFAPPPLRTASGRARDQAPRDWDDDAESAAFLAAMNNLNAR